MSEQIKKMYGEQKRGRLKAVIVCLIVYFLMIGFISIFYGSPFPHKEKIVFIEMMQSGWINTHGYLLLLCAAVGLIAGIGSIIYKIMNRFKRLDDILLDKCDTKEYIEVMGNAVSYGKEMNLKGFQKTVFLLSQQKYVLAMIADWKLEEAQRYLNDEWVGNKNSKMHKKLKINCMLIGLYQSHNVEKFCAVFQDDGKAFHGSRLLVAEKFILEEQYRKAAELLSGYKEKVLYNEVSRNYLLGICYDKLGEQKKTEEYMKYVEVFGNTMPCKKQAQKWLMENSREASKQGEDSL